MTEWEKDMGVKLLGLVTFRDSTEVLKLIKLEIKKAVEEVEFSSAYNPYPKVLSKRGIE